MANNNANAPLIEPIPEITEWESRHQIAYWKSRALALEYENQMLYQHIHDAYAQQIQDYIDYMKEHNDGEDDDPQPNKKRHNKSLKEKKKSKQRPRQHHNGTVKGEKGNGATDKTASKPLWQIKEENVKTLYGIMSPRIGGMETAVQLNYETYLAKLKPKYWPNIGIKL